MNHPTRKLVGVVTALGLACLMAGCKTNAGSKADSSSGPIKIGVVAILSGPNAQIGESHEAGAQLAADQINKAGGIDGRKVQLVVKDEQGDPNTSVQVARDLIGSGVKLIAGYTLDPDCLAASPVISNAGGVMIGLSCQGDSLTGAKLTPGYFEIAPSVSMLSAATALTAADRHLENWQGVSPDYDFGHEVWAKFGEDLKARVSSAKVGKGVFVPLTETKVTPYISSLISSLPSNSAKSTGLFMSTFAATNIALVQQGKPYNFFSKYGAVLNLGGSTPTAEALGANTPAMTYIYDYFDGAYDNAANTAFVDSYHAAHDGKRPNAWAYEGYTAVMALKAAIEKAGSSDPAKVRTALPGLSFDSPKGTFTFREEDHLPVTPVSVWSVVGDKSSPGGFKITDAKAVPADDVMPEPAN